MQSARITTINHYDAMTARVRISIEKTKKPLRYTRVFDHQNRQITRSRLASSSCFLLTRPHGLHRPTIAMGKAKDRRRLTSVHRGKPWPPRGARNGADAAHIGINEGR